MGNQYQFKHGLYQSPEYFAWSNMIQRCTNPKNSQYFRYGGRGIKVCDRWLESAAFLADMGPRPTPKHSIERNNNDGNYEPSNCSWADKKTQSRNKSSNVMIEFHGETKCIADWAAHIEIPFMTLSARIQRYGWNIEEALTIKPQKGKRPDRLREEAGTLITFNGLSMSSYQWAEHLGLSVPALSFRLNNWPLEKALTTKRKKWTRRVNS